MGGAILFPDEDTSVTVLTVPVPECSVCMCVRAGIILCPCMTCYVLILMHIDAYKNYAVIMNNIF